jgi:hypothetical protein
MNKNSNKGNDHFMFGVRIFFGITSLCTGFYFLYDNSIVAGIIAILFGILAFLPQRNK